MDTFGACAMGFFLLVALCAAVAMLTNEKN